jgi:hypothetical protein
LDCGRIKRKYMAAKIRIIGRNVKNELPDVAPSAAST